MKELLTVTQRKLLITLLGMATSTGVLAAGLIPAEVWEVVFCGYGLGYLGVNVWQKKVMNDQSGS